MTCYSTFDSLVGELLLVGEETPRGVKIGRAHV